MSEDWSAASSAPRTSRSTLKLWGGPLALCLGLGGWGWWGASDDATPQERPRALGEVGFLFEVRDQRPTQLSSPPTIYPISSGSSGKRAPSSPQTATRATGSPVLRGGEPSALTRFNRGSTEAPQGSLTRAPAPNLKARPLVDDASLRAERERVALEQIREATREATRVESQRLKTAPRSSTSRAHPARDDLSSGSSTSNRPHALPRPDPREEPPTAPVKSAPVKSAPAKRAPVKSAPVKSAPAKRTPAKSAPAKRAPAKSDSRLASTSSGESSQRSESSRRSVSWDQAKFSLQVRAFRKEADAEKFLDELDREWPQLPTRIITAMSKGKPIYRAFLGAFKQRRDAQKIRREFTKKYGAQHKPFIKALR